MWQWVGEPHDYDKLVDADGKNVLFPVGSHDCSAFRPDSHGIRVSEANAKLIASIPEMQAELYKLQTDLDKYKAWYTKVKELCL